MGDDLRCQVFGEPVLEPQRIQTKQLGGGEGEWGGGREPAPGLVLSRESYRMALLSENMLETKQQAEIPVQETCKTR